MADPFDKLRAASSYRRKKSQYRINIKAAVKSDPTTAHTPRPAYMSR